MSASPAPRGIRRQAADLVRRLRAGEHLALLGPRGSGKTTLLDAVARGLDGTPCGRSARTGSLDDITTAWQQAYPGVRTRGVRRRTARARLWAAADAETGVLLLDDTRLVNTQMKGQLRRLRGRIAGVALAFDVDSPRERTAVRQQRLGCAVVNMKPLEARIQRRILREHWERRGLPQLAPSDEGELIRAARGRPGWLVACAGLAAEPRFWRGDGLRTTRLALDTELTLRGGSTAQ